MNTNRIIITELDGIDHSDYPKYCDAYVSKASWKNGLDLTEQQLNDLQEHNDYEDMIQSFISQGGLR